MAYHIGCQRLAHQLTQRTNTMNTTIEEFEKWLLKQEKPEATSGMTLGKMNEYRTHMCKIAFEGGFNAAQSILSQGEPVYFGLLTDKYGWESITEKQYINHNKNDTYLSVNKYYIAPPSTESLQKDNANLKEQLSKMRHDLDKVTSTLEIKAKDLAWWQNQFQSKSGVETKDIAASFVELIEYANTAFYLVQKLYQNTLSHNPMNQIMNDAHIFFRQQRPKCME